MKKLLVFIGAVFMCAFAHGDTFNQYWYTESGLYAQTTCQTGGNISLPNAAPTKYGYDFIGWEKAPFIPIEYLESTGTQYIDTGIDVPDSSTTITVFEGKAAYITTGRNYIAGYQNYLVAHYCEFVNNKFGVNDGAGGYFSPVLLAGTPYDVYMQINGSANTMLGINVSGNNYSYSVTKYQSATMGRFVLFRLDSNYVSSGLRLYNSKITIDNVLIRDFIPVLDKYGTPCMFDKVEGKFYYNAGTGNFIAGPVLSE